MKLPLRAPRSGLLPEWQLPLRRPEDKDVHTLTTRSTTPIAGGTQVFGYSLRVHEAEIMVLDKVMAGHHLEATPLRIWERSSDGRGFHETIALTYILPHRALTFFAPPADEYLRRLQSNLDTYWGGGISTDNLDVSVPGDANSSSSGPLGQVLGGGGLAEPRLGPRGSQLKVKDGYGHLMYEWAAEFGRMRYAIPTLEEWPLCVGSLPTTEEGPDNETDQEEAEVPGITGGYPGWEKGLVGFFLALGSQLRWRCVPVWWLVARWIHALLRICVRACVRAWVPVSGWCSIPTGRSKSVQRSDLTRSS